MEKLLKKPLTLTRATVLHANKYTETRGGYSFPIWSILYTDIVFRLEDTQEDIPYYSKGIDLKLYTSQEILLVRSGEMIVAYVDLKTKKYYYITNNFPKKLRKGIPFYLVWLLGIPSGILIIMLSRNTTLWAFAPIFILWVAYLVSIVDINRRARREIDEFLG
jgi:hypothetical protein